MTDTKTCGLHGRRVCAECVVVTDAAKRAFDIVNSYVTFTDFSYRVRCWVALRLADGGSDGTLYESRRDVIWYTRNRMEGFCYFGYREDPNGFRSVRDAQIRLDFWRAGWEQGWAKSLIDPDDIAGGLSPILPTTEEQLMLLRQTMIRKN